MDPVSDWFTEALEVHRPVEYPWREEAPEDDVEEGDILIVTSMDGREPADRMVVAFDVEPERRSFYGILVTNEAPMAVGSDLILNPEDTRLPYRIAATVRATGWLWYVQIKRRVGALTDEALDALSAAHCDVDHDFHLSRRGLPLLRKPQDLRWPVLTAEFSHMQALAADCTYKRLEKDFELPFADPRLLADSKGVPLPDEETIQRLTSETRGFSPGCAVWAVNHLDSQRFRAFQPLLAPRSRPAPAPVPDDCSLPLNTANGTADRLLRSTLADAMDIASFVKIAVVEDTDNAQPRHQTFRYGSRRAEYILNPILKVS